MGFSRQEYWNGLPFLFPGDLPDPEIKPGSPALQADSLPSELPGKPQRKLSLSKITKIHWYTLYVILQNFTEVPYAAASSDCSMSPF